MPHETLGSHNHVKWLTPVYIYKHIRNRDYVYGKWQYLELGLWKQYERNNKVNMWAVYKDNNKKININIKFLSPMSKLHTNFHLET